MNSQDAPSTSPFAELPRLSIAHLMLATAAIAAVLGIYKAIENSIETTVPMQWLLTLAWAPGSVAVGLGIYLLLWHTVRSLQGKPSILREPGAKFAAILGVQGIISLIYLCFWRMIAWTPIPTYPTSLVLHLFFESISLGIGAFAIYWIRDTPWRVIIIGRCATIFRGLLVNFGYLTGGFTGWRYVRVVSTGSMVVLGFVHLAVLVALAISLAGDWQSHRPRHWTHYLGVVLLCLALFSTWCTFTWDILINSSF